MPKNFQTSQYDEPICTDGYLDVEVETDDGPRTFRIEIERVHMEEDTGKSLHVGGATGRIHGADYSLVDYNRAGIPLIEIVTKPVEGTGALAPEVARAYVTALRELMRALGVSDVRMEQGSLRCDVNVSLRPSPARPAGAPGRRPRTSTRCARSSAPCGTRSSGRPRCCAAGGRVVQETRHWHEDTGTHDVRPVQGAGRGLPLLPRARPRAGRAGPARGSRSCAPALPEPPAVRRRELQDEWGVSDLDMQALVNAGAVDLVEARSPPARRPRPPASGGWASWPGSANERGVDLAELPITPAQVARVVALVESGALNDKLARQVIEGVLAGEGEPDEVVAARGLAVVSDDARAAGGGRRGARRPTRTSPRRSAAARWRRPGRWSAR